MEVDEADGIVDQLPMDVIDEGNQHEPPTRVTDEEHRRVNSTAEMEDESDSETDDEYSEEEDDDKNDPDWKLEDVNDAVFDFQAEDRNCKFSLFSLT